MSDSHLDNSTFSVFYKMTPEKYLGIFPSILSILTSPMYYSVYWYNRNCSNKDQSLLHHLAMSSCLCGLAYNVFQSPLELFTTCFQPLNETICAWSAISRNIISCHFLCLLGTMYIVKYVYIFIYKNPVGANNEFWCFFINIAILLWQFVFQYADFVTLPKKFYGFYISSNTLPESGAQSRFKFPVQGSFLMCAISYIVVELRIQHLKRQEKKLLLEK